MPSYGIEVGGLIMENKENKSPTIELGRIIQTERINEAKMNNSRFRKEVDRSFLKYCYADFSDMSQEDIDLNKSAITNGDDRIFGAYNTSLGKIYIITEHDRSYTTILFADEY